MGNQFTQNTRTKHMYKILGNSAVGQDRDDIQCLNVEDAKLRVEESHKSPAMWKSHILREAFKKSSIFQNLIQQTPLRHLYNPRNRYIQENPKESKTDEINSMFQKTFKKLMMLDAINLESKIIANDHKLARKCKSHKVLTKPSHKREPFRKSNSPPDTNLGSSDSKVSLKSDSHEDKKDSKNSKTYTKFPYIMNNPKIDSKMILKENPGENSKTCSANSLYLDSLMHIKLPHLKHTCFDKQLMNYSHNNAKKSGKSSGAESGGSKDSKKSKKGSKKDSKKKSGKKDAESSDSKDAKKGSKKAKKGSKKDSKKKGGKKDAESSGGESGDSKDAKKGSKKAKKGSKKDSKKKGGKKDAESSGGESGDSKDVTKDSKKDKTGSKKGGKKKDSKKGAVSTDSESERGSKKGKKDEKEKKGSKKNPIKKEGASTDADSESEGDSKTGKKGLKKSKKESKKGEKKKTEMKAAESTESESEANIIKEKKRSKKKRNDSKKEAKKDAKKDTETTASESEVSSKAGTMKLTKTKRTDTESDTTSIDVKKTGFRMSSKKTTFSEKGQKPMMGRVPPSRERPPLPPCEPYILSPKVRRVCRCNIPPLPPKPRYAPLPGVEWIHKLL
uniref:cylicin-1 n=1 Tax=Jaculus jaculus TaxID=51337 RepID=UPI001E1B270D|nr:cylicin-1 [Jaculus jaculus]